MPGYNQADGWSPHGCTPKVGVRFECADGGAMAIGYGLLGALPGGRMWGTGGGASCGGVEAGFIGLQAWTRRLDPQVSA